MTEVVPQSSSSGHPFTRWIDDEPSPPFFMPVASITPREVSRNATIYCEGTPVGQLYKVVSGAVRTCSFTADGRRHIGAFYLPGELFGLETETTHVFSAEAVVDSQVLAIGYFAVLFDRWEFEVATQTWDLMRRELRRARDRMLLLGKTAYERMVSFLLEMAERTTSGDQIELAMPRQDIADYLGLTIETVSRMLAQLESEAAIGVQCRRIVLRKRAALRRLAG